jgi:hypothetical protein
VSSGAAKIVEESAEPSRTPAGAAVRAVPSIGGPAGRAFTSVTRILRGHEAPLAEYLTELGTTIPSPEDIEAGVARADIRFGALRTVHFFRWVVVKDSAGDPWLAFESNYDGSLDDHLGELVREGAPAVHTIGGHCEGYPLANAPGIDASGVPVVVAYLARQSIDYAAFYAAMPGKTVERIRVESQIRSAIEAFVDDRRANGAFRDAAPGVIYDAIVDHLATVGLLGAAQAPQAAPPESRVLPWLVRALPLAALLPVAPLFYVVLRWKEATDPEDDVTVAPPGIQALADREDFQVQNQLTHLVDVKPGLFRRNLLRLVLWLIDLLAKYQFNQGQLGGITTIHFARWAFIDGGKRLLFFSNYDGSWENYLGEFIDQASTGLTGVWSNTAGFPRTQNLVQKGATDEERFKSWTRAHQLPTQFWYSAYPTLTVFNVKQNAQICAGLASRPATEQAMLSWLECL